MNEIKCPECGSKITIDENSYSHITKQVRDQEFEDEMNKRVELIERDKKKSVDLANQNFQLKLQEATFANDKKLRDLESRLVAAEAEKTMAVNKIKHSIEKERDSFSYLLEKTREKNDYEKGLLRVTAKIQYISLQAPLLVLSQSSFWAALPS